MNPGKDSADHDRQGTPASATPAPATPIPEVDNMCYGTFRGKHFAIYKYADALDIFEIARSLTVELHQDTQIEAERALREALGR